MGYSRSVQIGRVVLVSYGPNTGRLATIVDVADEKHVLIDGPSTCVPRQLVNTNRIRLTNLVMKIPVNARTSTVRKQWTKQKITESFTKSSWGQKIAARRLRTGLSDFGRFKVMLARQTRRAVIHKEFLKLKKAALKAKAASKGKAPKTKKVPKKAGGKGGADKGKAGSDKGKDAGKGADKGKDAAKDAKAGDKGKDAPKDAKAGDKGKDAPKDAKAGDKGKDAPKDAKAGDKGKDAPKDAKK